MPKRSDIRAISLAIPSGVSTMSTAPDKIALRGMPSYCAEAGSWANVQPPSALIACTPIVPSEAIPDRTTPIACSFRSSASDRKNRSIGRWRPLASVRGESFRTPFKQAHIVIGRNDVDVIRLQRHSVPHLGHRHSAYPRKDIGGEASMLWIQMLNDNEGDSHFRRKLLQQFGHRRQTAGRCADANNRKRWQRQC